MLQNLSNSVLILHNKKTAESQFVTKRKTGPINRVNLFAHLMTIYTPCYHLLFIKMYGSLYIFLADTNLLHFKNAIAVI